MAKQSMQNLTSYEGEIANIPKPHVAVINFTLKNQRVQAFFFTPSYYHNGQRIPNQQTPLTKFIKIGDTIHFDAVPNLKENSFNIRWRAVAVWKGSQKPKVLTSTSSTVENRQGHVIYVDDSDGLIKCSRSEEKCLFSYLTLFINNKRPPAGLSLKAFVSEGEYVQFQAEHKTGTFVGHVYRWEALRVWKEDFDSFDTATGLASFDEFHESDSEWISVESKKSKKAAVPTISPAPVVVNHPVPVPRVNRVFPQEMLSKQLGIITDVDFRRAVASFACMGSKERVLIVRDKYEGGGSLTLKELLSLGDKVLFDCHLYDKPDGLDKCKWFATKCVKFTGVGAVVPTEEVKTFPASGSVICNQTAKVTDVSPNMGEVLLLSGDHEGERISFQSKAFLLNGKPLAYGMNLKDFVKPNERVQVDAKYSDEDGEGMWFSWCATAVWKGEKFASYRAAVETNNENASKVDLDKSLDVATSYSDIFTHSEQSPATSENSAALSKFGSPPNSNGEVWPPEPETPWDAEPEKEVVKAPVGFSEANSKPSQSFSFSSMNNYTKDEKSLESQLKDLMKPIPLVQEKKHSTSSAASFVLGNTQTTAVNSNPIPAATNASTKPDTNSASVSLMVDLVKQLEQVTLSAKNIMRIMYRIIDSTRRNNRLTSDQEAFLIVLDQLKPFLDVHPNSGEGCLEKDYLKDPNGLIKTLFELLRPSSSNPNIASILPTVNNTMPMVPTNLIPGSLPQAVLPINSQLPVSYDLNALTQNSNMAQANTTQSTNRLHQTLQYAGNFNIASLTGQQPVTTNLNIAAPQSTANSINLAALGGQQTNATGFNFAALGGQAQSTGQLNLAALSSQAHPHPSLSQHPLAALGGQHPMAAQLNFASLGGHAGLNLAGFNAPHIDGSIHQANPNLHLAALTAQQNNLNLANPSLTPLHQATATTTTTAANSTPSELPNPKIADLAERLESIGLPPSMMEGTLKQLVDSPNGGADEAISSALEQVKILERHLTNSSSNPSSGAPHMPFLSGGHQHLGVSPAPQHGGQPKESSSSQQVYVGTGEIGEVLKEDEGYLLWKSPTTRNVEKVHFTRKVCFLMNIQLDKVDIRSVIKPGLKVDFKAEKISKADSPYNWEAIEVEAKKVMVVGRLVIEGFGDESSRSRMQQHHHIVFQQGDHKYLQWVLPVQQRLAGGRSLLGNRTIGSRNTGGVITSTTRSLDLIRQIIQKHINRDINNIIHSYLEKYVKPGMENIRDNKGEGSVTEEHVNYICRQILEEAKSMYPAPQSHSGSPSHDLSDQDAPFEGKRRRSSSSSPRRKRKESDTDSECSQPTSKRRPRIPSASTPLRPRDVIRWDPNSVTTSTRFIMGSRANKALGFGQTRGRLYIRHTELYKYSGDQADKEWLARQHLLPGAGGKAYLMILEEVKKLAETDDYRNNPGVMPSELIGFTVPGFMIEKVRNHMQQQKNEALSGTQQQQNNVSLEATSLLQELVSGHTDRRPSLPVSDSDGIDSPLLPLDEIGSSHGTPTSELNAVLDSSFDFASSPKV